MQHTVRMITSTGLTLVPIITVQEVKIRIAGPGVSHFPIGAPRSYPWTAFLVEGWELLAGHVANLKLPTPVGHFLGLLCGFEGDYLGADRGWSRSPEDATLLVILASSPLADSFASNRLASQCDVHCGPVGRG